MHERLRPIVQCCHRPLLAILQWHNAEHDTEINAASTGHNRNHSNSSCTVYIGLCNWKYHILCAIVISIEHWMEVTVWEKIIRPYGTTLARNVCIQSEDTSVPIDCRELRVQNTWKANHICRCCCHCSATPASFVIALSEPEKFNIRIFCRNTQM